MSFRQNEKENSKQLSPSSAKPGFVSKQAFLLVVIGVLLTSSLIIGVNQLFLEQKFKYTNSSINEVKELIEENNFVLAKKRIKTILSDSINKYDRQLIDVLITECREKEETYIDAVSTRLDKMALRLDSLEESYFLDRWKTKDRKKIYDDLEFFYQYSFKYQNNCVDKIIIKARDINSRLKYFNKTLGQIEYDSTVQKLLSVIDKKVGTFKIKGDSLLITTVNRIDNKGDIVNPYVLHKTIEALIFNELNFYFVRYEIYDEIEKEQFEINKYKRFNTKYIQMPRYEFEEKECGGAYEEGLELA